MTKFIRHDFGGILDALNKMIIAEVKAALELLPGKRICWNGKTPLCHIILSPGEEYIPREVEVIDASIAQEDGLGGALVIAGFNADTGSNFAINWFENETDWLEITDFGYLIDQIAEQIEGDRTVNLPTKTVLTCDIAPEFELKTAIEKTI